MTASMVAITTSTAAMAMSAAAERTACEAVVAVGSPAGSSVAQMKSYAACVQSLYPDASSPGLIIFLKVLFVLALVGAVVGFRSERNMEFRLMAGVMGAVLAPIALVALAGVCTGIYWLFT